MSHKKALSKRQRAKGVVRVKVNITPPKQRPDQVTLARVLSRQIYESLKQSRAA